MSDPCVEHLCSSSPKPGQREPSCSLVPPGGKTVQPKHATQRSTARKPTLRTTARSGDSTLQVSSQAKSHGSQHADVPSPTPSPTGLVGGGSQSDKRTAPSPSSTVTPTVTSAEQELDATPAARETWVSRGSAKAQKLDHGGGLLSRAFFSRYDVNLDGKLGVAEFVRLLRSNRVPVDYARACQIMALGSGHTVREIHFDQFASIFQKEVFRGQEPGLDSLLVARSIFNSYDANKNKLLQGPELVKLFNDCHLSECRQDVSADAAEAHDDRAPHALTFQQFVAFMRERFSNHGEESITSPREPC